jgi:hypothetical protein
MPAVAIPPTDPDAAAASRWPEHMRRAGVALSLSLRPIHGRLVAPNGQGVSVKPAGAKP